MYCFYFKFKKQKNKPKLYKQYLSCTFTKKPKDLKIFRLFIRHFEIWTEEIPSQLSAGFYHNFL